MPTKSNDSDGYLPSDTEPWTPAEYIEKRVRHKIESYTRKGERYRWGHTFIAIATMIGAAVVPVLVQAGPSVPIVLVTCVSLLVTILVGLEGIIHFRGHWRNYDMMKTFLRAELNLYLGRTGHYRDVGNTSAAFSHFVERIESAISTERSQTIEMRTAAHTTPKKGAEQDGADQPATRSESKSGGNEKSKPEVEGRSR